MGPRFFRSSDGASARGGCARRYGRRSSAFESFYRVRGGDQSRGRRTRPVQRASVSPGPGWAGGKERAANALVGNGRTGKQRETMASDRRRHRRRPHHSSRQTGPRSSTARFVRSNRSWHASALFYSFLLTLPLLSHREISRARSARQLKSAGSSRAPGLDRSSRDPSIRRPHLARIARGGGVRISRSMYRLAAPFRRRIRWRIWTDRMIAGVFLLIPCPGVGSCYFYAPLLPLSHGAPPFCGD